MSWFPKSSRMPAVVHLRGLLFVYAYYCSPRHTVYAYYRCLLLYLVCCLNWLGSIALYQLPRINCRVLIVSYQLTWIDCLDCLPHIACLVLSIASLYQLPHIDCLDSLPCIDCLVVSIALYWLPCDCLIVTHIDCLLCCCACFDWAWHCLPEYLQNNSCRLFCCFASSRCRILIKILGGKSPFDALEDCNHQICTKTTRVAPKQL
jgi:hypothetical protein